MLNIPARHTPVPSFEELHAQYYLLILRWVKQRVNLKEDAEDITQAVFMETWIHYNELQPHWNIKAWLFTVASHRVINFYRSAHTRRVTSLESIEFDRENEQDMIAQADTRVDIQRTLGELAPMEVTLLNLGYIYGYTSEEASRFLGITTEDNARKKRTDARKRFKKLYKPQERKLEVEVSNG